MSKQFEQFTDICTGGLKDDPERRLDIRQELLSHLEAEYDELKIVEPDDEKRNELCKARFGDPEEISHGLLTANFSRLKRRAKIRSAMKILFIPAMLVGLYFCIDWRSVLGIYALSGMLRVCEDVNPNLRMADWDNAAKVIYKERKLFAGMTPEEKFLIFGEKDLPDNSPEHCRKLIDIYPEQPVFIANYISSLLAMQIPLSPEQLETELKTAESLDPENAYYNYSAAAAYLEKAVRIDKNNAIELVDRNMLDKAMQEVRKGNSKPYCNTYLTEMFEKKRATLRFSQDFLGLIGRIYVTTSYCLPNLNDMRKIARILPFYGDIMASEGRKEDAEFYYDAWKKFVLNNLENSGTLLDALVSAASMSIQYDAAVLRNDERRIKELETGMSVVNEWRKKKDMNGKVLNNYGGFLAGIFIPAIKQEISAKDLEPERTLSYVMIDILTLATQGFFLFASICLYAIALGILYLKGKRGFFMTLSLKAYMRIFIYGFLLPVVFFFAITRIDMLSGRGFSIQYNLMNSYLILPSLGVIFLMFGIPAIFIMIFMRELGNRGRQLGFEKIPQATLYLNLMYSWVCLLILGGCMIGSVLSYEQRQAVKRDALLCGKAFTSVEDRFSRRLNNEMKENIRSVMTGK